LTDKKNKYTFFLTSFKRFFTDGNSRARLFFILLSVFLWVLIKLSKGGYTETVSFPVQYSNFPEDRLLINQPPEEINVTLRTQGFNLLGLKFRRFRKIKINVKEIERTASTGDSYWLTNSNLAFIESQFSEETDVLSVSPDTVHFKFSKLSRKKVPVKFQYEKLFSNATNFYNKPVVIPDSVIISGAEKYVASIENVETKPVELKADKDSIRIDVPLLQPHPEVQLSPKEVKIDIRYAKLTQGRVEVPVTVVNLPDSLNIVTFPRKVELSFNVPVEDFSKINEADFNVYADFNDLKEDMGSRYIKLKAESYAEVVSYMSFEPRQVEFVITPK